MQQTLSEQEILRREKRKQLIGMDINLYPAELKKNIRKQVKILKIYRSLEGSMSMRIIGSISLAEFQDSYRRIKNSILIVVVALLLNSCASLVSRNTYPLNVITNPVGANIAIKDADGVQIFEGRSPCIVDLKASSGFFKKAFYSIIVSKEGYDKQIILVNSEVDAWYFVNILPGFLFTFLVPFSIATSNLSTGAKYRNAFFSLLFGYLAPTIGMLIVDPATGAMYKIESSQVFVTLSEGSSRANNSELRIYDIEDIPEKWKDKLIRINP